MIYVSERTEWEYEILTRSANGDLLSEEELNALGSAGWELTGVVGQGDRVHFFLKRPRT